MSDEPLAFLDGNAAAGPLRELFAVDLTSAVARCGDCGRSARVAEAHLYNHAPGLVLRCAGCDHVLIRMVSSPGRTWLDMGGVSILQLEVL
jgi:Family of unknown function (DUF6510)